MAHRYLIGAALSGKTCTLSGVDYSEDILATIDCLKALGAGITMKEDTVVIETGSDRSKIRILKGAVAQVREKA